MGREAPRPVGVGRELLQVVFDALPVPLVLVGVDGRVERVNVALERFAGRSASGLLGLSGLDVVEVLAPRFVDPEGFVRAARAGFASASSVQDERFALRRGGWLRRWSLPLGGDGYGGRLVVFADVSTGVAEKERAERLSVELVRAQERERARIASELHDGPVQLLAASLMRLERLGRTGGGEDLGASVEALRGDLGATYGELRSLLFNLRPETLTREGLGAAVRLLLDQFQAQTGVESELDDRLSEREAGERGLVAFRVLHEALANVRKHAEATRVRVVLELAGEELVVEIIDDGRGFRPDEVQMEALFGHLGLLTMRERVELARGRFELRSADGEGTQIAFRLPAFAASG